MKSHKFIFIGGMHRSGTTLLARLLRGHSDISGFENTKAPMDEGQHLQNVYPDPINYGTVGQFGFNDSAYLDEKSAIVSEENREKLFQQWVKYWDLTKPYLLEKSPPNIIRTRFLQEMFSMSYFILIKRHPIAVSFATKSFSRKQLELERLLEHWITCHQQLEKDLPYLKNVLVINYEGLVSNPGEVLGQISTFLGISQFDIPQNIKPHTNHKYVQKWRNLPEAERTSIINKYEKDIQALGYSLKDFT